MEEFFEINGKNIPESKVNSDINAAIIGAMSLISAKSSVSSKRKI